MFLVNQELSNGESVKAGEVMTLKFYTEHTKNSWLETLYSLAKQDVLRFLPVCPECSCQYCAYVSCKERRLL